MSVDAAMSTMLPPPPPVAAALLHANATMRRPISVVVIAVLFFIGAAHELQGLLGGNTMGSAACNVVSDIDCSLFAIAQIIMGIGLLKCRAWARRGAIITLIVRFVTEVPLLVWFIPQIKQFEGMPQVALYIGIAVLSVFMAIYYGVLIFFLTRQNVKAACTR